MNGQLTAWNDRCLEGSFGTPLWSELHYRDIWRLRRRLMDTRSPEAWLDLGRLLLMVSLDQPDAADLAERALAKAQQLDAGVSETVAQIRHEFFEAKKRREETRQTQLSTADPEAAHWPADEWPELGPADQHAALRTIREKADEIAAEAGLLGSPLDTGHFLLYGDVSAERLAAVGAELESVYSILADFLEAKEPGNIFWGRAIVYLIPSEDRFRLLEAQRFKQIVEPDRIGIAHFVGPQAFILIREDADAMKFEFLLARVVTHAFLHRLISPRRLPAWANEGLAEHIASQRTRGKSWEEAKRRTALSFIRGGGDVLALLQATYDSEAWPGPERVGEEVGGLLVELLARTDREATMRWVKSVKGGAEWTDALAREFGTTPGQFAQAAVRYYRVNE